MSYVYSLKPGSVLFCSGKSNIPSSAVLISESVQWIIGITAAVVGKRTWCPTSLRNNDFGNVAIQRRISARLLLHLADEGEFRLVYAAMTDGELVRCHTVSK